MASLLFISILQQDQTLDLLSGNREVIELLIVVLHIIPSFACLPHMINLLSATVNRGRDNCAFIRAAVHFIYNRYLSSQTRLISIVMIITGLAAVASVAPVLVYLQTENFKIQHLVFMSHQICPVPVPPHRYIFMGEPQYTYMSQGN